MGPVWDIEELVEMAREEEVCPYFSARDLMKDADIIFCPYNYIVDPDIRASVSRPRKRILCFHETKLEIFYRIPRCN